MGRDLQKKKNRSSRQPIRQAQRKKLMNPLGNSIIAKNWNKKETLSQNYRRLGLVSRLRGATGGIETLVSQGRGPHADPDAKPTSRAFLAIENTDGAVIGETRVERDADGRILRVVGGKRKSNPLNDPLNDIEDQAEADDDEDAEEWGGIEDGGAPTTDVVRALEEMASRPEVKRVRHVSEREREWLDRLVQKHGDDTEAMARDRKLNPMQQTAADIARRIRKSKA
ncbi:related to NOP16 constituent of 66S pre-ribosomal particles [Cephalotrichum gorgonifer]|uniref:Nucleolar protein 16 n=1 Tax=Cephalotrichum gorgonifer TaxID=2041049 RepID=A0AAE8SS19_9PEZI|nr:related to NOP16 constituent of 66S pre-ribosomal particles [Cephalotrichum gorgonifer]